MLNNADNNNVNDKSLLTALWWGSGMFGFHRFYIKSWQGMIYLPLFITATLFAFTPSMFWKALAIPLYVIVVALLVRDIVAINHSSLKETQSKHRKWLYFTIGLAAEVIIGITVFFLVATMMMAMSL